MHINQKRVLSDISEYLLNAHSKCCEPDNVMPLPAPRAALNSQAMCMEVCVCLVKSNRKESLGCSVSSKNPKMKKNDQVPWWQHSCFCSSSLYARACRALEYKLHTSSISHQTQGLQANLTDTSHPANENWAANEPPQRSTQSSSNVPHQCCTTRLLSTGIETFLSLVSLFLSLHFHLQQY